MVVIIKLFNIYPREFLRRYFIFEDKWNKLQILAYNLRKVLLNESRQFKIPTRRTL